MVQRNSKELGRLETVEHTRQRNGRVPGQLDGRVRGQLETAENEDN